MTWRLWLVFAIFQCVRNCCSGVDITECQKGNTQFGEGTNVNLTCGEYDFNIEWMYGDDLRIVIGQCDRDNCTTLDHLSFSLQAHKTGSERYKSVLSITNISSEQTFHLKCHDKYLDEEAKCLLHVVKPPQYDRTKCKVWVSNWRVLGECTVERMAVSGVQYDCFWSVNNTGKFGGFKDIPSYYTLHSVNYTRRVCSFNRTMNFTENAYAYSINIPGITDHFAETITVEHPGEPTHNCPTMVGEGSSVTCRCNSSKAGNPPATTVWDGVKNETLHIENIQRQTKTNVYTCRVVWGSDGWINRSTLYTFDVAYGPSSVSIDYIIHETGNEREKRLLICTAVDVHPSAIFRWSITCDTQTQNSYTSTCTLSTAKVSQRTVVTCTARNNFSSDMSSFSSFVFDHTGGKSPGSENNSNVVFIFLFLGLIPIVIIVVVIAILYRRKALMSKPRESSTRASLPETEDSAPESPTTSSHYVNTMARKEETEKGAKCNNDTLQSKMSTDYDEVCDLLTPERCAAPSGDVYTIASKGSHHLNRETSDHNTPTIEAVIEGGASNFTQDEIDMSGEYYHEIKHVKKSEPKRDIGVSGDIHRKADKDKKREDAKFSQKVPLLIRLESSESESQSTVDGCVSPSRGIYANVTETCNWQDDDNDDDSPHSLWLEAADVDMNVPMGTWVKSGERVSGSSSYLHPIPPDDDTYNRLML